MTPGFRIDMRGQTCVVALESDLTAALVGTLQPAIKERLTGGVAEVEVDLARTTMLDSSGIGLLIATSNTLSRAGGRLQVVNVSKDIERLLQSMRLSGRLNVRGKA